jgi:hypothetical protein
MTTRSRTGRVLLLGGRWLLASLVFPFWVLRSNLRTATLDAMDYVCRD